MASVFSSLSILEVLPPTAAFTVMAVTILSVWAAQCAEDTSNVHESAPDAYHVHKYAPEGKCNVRIGFCFIFMSFILESVCCVLIGSMVHVSCSD